MPNDFPDWSKFTTAAPPQPWEAPRAIFTSSAIATASTQFTLFTPAPPAGQDVYLHDFFIWMQATGTFTIKGHTSGVNLFLWNANSSAPGSPTWWTWRGSRLGLITGTAGEPIDMVNTTGTSQGFWATLSYAIGPIVSGF